MQEPEAKKRMIIRTNSVNLDAANLMFIEL